MIRDRLKELEIRITELADYLQISRTTLYKFIELYDSGQQKDVNPSVRKLFDFIENNELIGKKNVMVSQYLSKKRGLGEYFKGQEMDGIIDIWADGLINGEDSFTICEICKCVNKNERRTHLGSRKKPAFH